MCPMPDGMKAVATVIVAAVFSLSVANAQNASNFNNEWAADIFGVAVRDQRAASDQDWLELVGAELRAAITL